MKMPVDFKAMMLLVYRVRIEAWMTVRSLSMLSDPKRAVGLSPRLPL